MDGIRFTLVERVPLVELGRGRVPRRGPRDRRPARGRQTIYFAGDTCVFGDMALIARLHELDLAVLPIGDWFTMGPGEAALALELLGQSALRAVPLGHVPGPDRQARRARGAAPNATIEGSTGRHIEV